MFDYNSIVSSDELTMEFERSSEISIIAKDAKTGCEAGLIQIEGCTLNPSSDDILLQYKLWNTRPERLVGKKVDIEGTSLGQLIDIYEELFIGAYILTQHAEVKAPIKSNKFVYAIDWLRTTDFYNAPASTKYHESFPGGLLVHSLKVYNKMIDLLAANEFKNVSIADATMVALVHDWCKIHFYEAYNKNVKNEATGQWEKETAYKVNQKGLPLGHGTTSLYLASLLMKLTPDQALAIRWHMGEYNVADNEINELQKANATCPMVYLIQFADRLACTEF